MLIKSLLFRLILSLPLLLLAAAPAGAESTQTPAQWTTAQVLERNEQARGGAAAWQAIHTLRTFGKAQFGDGDFHVDAVTASLVDRGGSSAQARIRTEVTLQGLTAVQAFDGQQGWSVEPFGGRRDPQRLSADGGRSLARDAQWEGPLLGWQEKGHKISYLGLDDLDGTPALKLQVQRKDGDTQWVYLDPDTFLEVRVITQSKIRGTERWTETDLGGYARVSGVWLPMTADAGLKGGPRTDHWTTERIEINGQLPDGAFAYPQPGQPVLRQLLPAAGPGAPLDTTPPAVPTAAVSLDSGILDGLGARNIGSAAMSGRVSTLAAVSEGGKTLLYVGAASGGVWKSPDGGTTFTPVFDKQPVQSIGAIAIDPHNSQVVWVGTGEAWTRNSASVGDGVYKSSDGGKNWIHVGLADSERIVRIIVHPKHSDVVFACVTGKLWSDSGERGVYKTQDGGKHWQQVLKGANASTGCSSLSLDPQNSDVILAGLWDFRRQGWTFRSGGAGPDAPSSSGLFRSSDGGSTWIDVSKNKGLPAAPWGRVEATFAPSNPKIVYALVESTQSGLFRSEDGGQTWQARDRSMGMVWRPFYFARLVVDPHQPDRIFKPDMNLIVSEDGGQSFAGSGGRAHGDWHDVWIDPSNTQHLIGGDDGGLWVSHDGGSHWLKNGNLPISQFYHVSVDDRDPYQIYGGLQDNSSWAGPSAYPGGITNQTWENLYNSDGFWVLVDPTDANAVYAEGQGGYVARIDRKTHAARDIQPKAGPHEKLRFNWNTPLHLSPTHQGTLYIGAQFLFRSADHGDSWQRISPDLTTNDPSKQKQEQSGGITVDNSSAEMHTTIYSISESPKDSKVIWVGTDDGNLQVTRDDGKNWRNVVGQIPDLPKNSWVSWVAASRFAAGTAYAAFDRHTFGDMQPWVYRTADFGQTWQRIVAPSQGVRGYAHCIVEDTQDPALLFVGTEFGLWISADSGGHWAAFHGNGFPSVAVRDIQVHGREHDLVIATHGRGIWIIDDLTPLRALKPEILEKTAAFLPSRRVQQRLYAQGGWSEGDGNFSGENPPSGAVFAYYQRARHLFGPLKLEVIDSDGQVLDTIPAQQHRGINRVSWTMQGRPPRVPKAAQVAFSASQGIRVLPGAYRLRLTKGMEVLEQNLQIDLDRRAPFGLPERQAQHATATRVHRLFGQMSDLVDRMDLLTRRVEAASALLPATATTERATAASFVQQVVELKREIVATKEGGAITGEERIREQLDILYGALLGWEGRPAQYQVERVDALTQELQEVDKRFAAVLEKGLPAVNGILKIHKLQEISLEGSTPPSAETVAISDRDLRCMASRGRQCTPPPTGSARGAAQRTR